MAVDGLCDVLGGWFVDRVGVEWLDWDSRWWNIEIIERC